PRRSKIVSVLPTECLLLYVPLKKCFVVSLLAVDMSQTTARTSSPISSVSLMTLFNSLDLLLWLMTGVARRRMLNGASKLLAANISTDMYSIVFPLGDRPKSLSRFGSIPSYRIIHLCILCADKEQKEEQNYSQVHSLLLTT
uniref:Uncharacterized protein n=1 Tax=Glossina palpalis gambiensis TaxID=67801 RepID=A0A1B0BY51_9MUSC